MAKTERVKLKDSAAINLVRYDSAESGRKSRRRKREAIASLRRSTFDPTTGRWVTRYGEDALPGKS